MIHNSDNVEIFLYGPSEIFRGPGSAKTSILMDERMEGWIGIPHGGISMGIMTDLVLACHGYPPGDTHPYPLSADFRLGGASLKIGDVLNFEISASGSGATGEALVAGEPFPYMSASFHYGGEYTRAQAPSMSILPEHADQVLKNITPLPYNKKCFVCGVERTFPGLKRQFHHWDAHGKTVISHAGFETGDRDTFYLFHRGHFLHPLPFLALLDETLGWGGFLISASGAVTVKIDYTFYRPVSVQEKLIFFGRGDRVRGKAGGRLLFWASGGAAVLKDDGRLEMVVSASGQWYGMPELTEQMKTALLPHDLTQKAFALAG